MSFMQLAKLKKLDKHRRLAVDGGEVETIACSSTKVSGNLETNLSKLRLLVKAASVAKPLGILKARSAHGKKDCRVLKKSSNSCEVKKNKLGE